MTVLSEFGRKTMDPGLWPLCSTSCAFEFVRTDRAHDKSPPRGFQGPPFYQGRLRQFPYFIFLCLRVQSLDVEETSILIMFKTSRGSPANLRFVQTLD